MKTVAIDFDGVIHDYREGWKDGSVYGEPTVGSFSAIEAFLQMGCTVVIFSTRNPHQIKEWMDEQLRYHIHSVVFQTVASDGKWTEYPFWNSSRTVLITNLKPAAYVYIDDRAVKYTNWLEDFHFVVGKLNGGN